MPNLTADEIITTLDLAPHPEGGFFRETFRDQDTINGGARSFSTAIYFLLKAGQVSRWHIVDAAETWHYYQGAPLQLAIAPPGGGQAKIEILGADLTAGERPQVVVPKGHWQQARAMGGFTLVGCTVAPGFQFSGFTLAPDDFEPGS